MTAQQIEPYPHHRSFWFADKVRLGDGRPVGLYTALYTGPNGRKDPGPPFNDRVRHVAFVEGPAAKDRAEITMKLAWEMDGNRPVLDETRHVRVVALDGGEYFLDVRCTLTAAHGDVTFVSDATHYAWPYIRIDPTFSVAGGGTITNSEGGTNQKGTHDQVARWVDYSGTVDGETAGLAVFSHPDNPHPHRWLTRDYGTFGPRRGRPERQALHGFQGRDDLPARRRAGTPRRRPRRLGGRTLRPVRRRGAVRPVPRSVDGDPDDGRLSICRNRSRPADEPRGNPRRPRMRSAMPDAPMPRSGDTPTAWNCFSSGPPRRCRGRSLRPSPTSNAQATAFRPCRSSASPSRCSGPEAEQSPVSLNPYRPCVGRSMTAELRGLAVDTEALPKATP